MKKLVTISPVPSRLSRGTGRDGTERDGTERDGTERDGTGFFKGPWDCTNTDTDTRTMHTRPRTYLSVLTGNRRGIFARIFLLASRRSRLLLLKSETFL